MLQQTEKDLNHESPPPYRGRDDSREYGLEYDDGQELPMPATATDRAASRRWIVQMVLVGVAVYYIITSYGRAAMSINWMHHGCSHHRFPLPLTLRIVKVAQEQMQTRATQSARLQYDLKVLTKIQHW